MSLIEKVSVAEGRQGDWAVERFVVDRQDWGSLLAGREVPLGQTFTRLTRRGYVVMSDTPSEMRDHYAPVFRGKGHCLVNGLGLGMVLAALLRKKDVERVTAVEISPEVIALVGPSYANDPRVEIVQASAFDYSPPKGTRYGMVWHDIWNDMCSDNLAEMGRLHRKYGRRCDWQGSWGREICERARERGC